MNFEKNITKDEVLKMALEALETSTDWDVSATGRQLKSMQAITALRTALAQTQEPVAWFSTLPDGKLSIKIVGKPTDGNWEPLYTTPPQRTEQEREACERCKQLEEQAYDLVGELRVANIKLSMRPQRPWVGLTEQQIKSLLSDSSCWIGDDCSMPNLMYIVRLVESTLREKNNGN